MVPTLDRDAVAAVDSTGQAGEIVGLGEHLSDALWRVDSAGIAPVDAPGGLIVAGMGLRGMLDTGLRRAAFVHVLEAMGTHPRGSPAWLAEAFLKTNNGDPQALRPLLDSFVDTAEAELRAIQVPTLVLSGAEDDDRLPGQRRRELGGPRDGRARASDSVAMMLHRSPVAPPEAGS